MKIAARELNLLFLTLAVVLLALTYLALEAKFQEWAQFEEQRTDLQVRRDQAQQYLESRETVEARLQEFRQGLPLYSLEHKVEADLLPGLEKMADQHGVELTSIRAFPERGTNDLYEISIECKGECDLPALVNFLYAQQSQGVVSDVRQMGVSPSKTKGAAPGQLSGTFTIDYAYRREAGATESKPDAPAGPAPAAETAQP